MKFPTSWMVEQMVTDVAMVGHSRFDFDGETALTMDADTITVTAPVKDSIDYQTLIDMVAPFFRGRHMNPITNHHDGRYTVAR